MLIPTRISQILYGTVSPVNVSQILINMRDIDSCLYQSNVLTSIDVAVDVVSVKSYMIINTGS